jgi:hypothetical protein
MQRLVLVLLVLAFALAGCTSTDVSRELGARCDRSEECDERCLTGGGYPGGFCSVSCDDDGACPGDSHCVDADGGVCLFACTSNTDCVFLGEGWRCDTRPGRPSGDVMVCRGP